jgi:5-methylcytosine-specific restriction enzyme subunit McrC
VTAEIGLVEGGETVFVQIDDAVMDVLVASDLVDVTYRAAGGVAISAKQKVGVARVGTTVVCIRPKIPIQRIFWLLGFTSDRGWRTSPVPFAVVDDLVAAIGDAYVRQVEPPLEEGPLQGYHEVDDSLTVIRGRVREQEQLRRQFGIPVPIHVHYDEFSADIAENRLLRTAAHRLVRLPRLDAAARPRLRHVDATLGDASLIEAAARPPTWRPTRLNQRFDLALWLAELIIRHTSLDQPLGSVRADGFIVDVAKVFEDFVSKSLGGELEAVGGTCVAQRLEWLDSDHAVELRPDLTWLQDGDPIAVIDAKYKAEKPSGIPNADIYQMLAYCTALTLPDGHLVYAKGNETERSTTIRNSGVEIRIHTVDLDAPPSSLLEQTDRIAQAIRRRSASTARPLSRSR